MILDYIYQHFTEFKLIFCCSTGSQYEHFLDELGKIEESYYQELVDKYGKEGFTVDPFFILYFAGQDGKRCMNLLHMIVPIKKLNHL